MKNHQTFFELAMSHERFEKNIQVLKLRHGHDDKIFDHLEKGQRRKRNEMLLVLWTKNREVSDAS